MTVPFLIDEMASALAEFIARLLLRIAAGGPVQLPRSNEDFALF